MPHIPLNGGRSIQTRLGRLWVRPVGSGPPAVIWHSLFVDSTTWHSVLNPLAAQRRLIVIDGPGHGSSQGPSGTYTLHDCVGAACDVLDEVGTTEPVDWVGNAWGGHVGIVFAATRQERCRSLVTIGAPVHSLSPSEHRIIAASRALYIVLGPVRPLVSAITSALLGPDSDPAHRRVVADAFRSAHRRDMATAIESISLRRENLTTTLGRISAPTLMVAASHDKLWTPAQAEAAAVMLPDGVSMNLPGGGHVAPLLQAADVLADVLIEFWNDPVSFVEGRSSART
jgi:pimeloyl-ACP methyl ester carboxylesterase